MTPKAGRGGCFFCRWGLVDTLGDKGLVCTHPLVPVRTRWDQVREDESLCGAVGRWWEAPGELPLKPREIEP